MFGLDALKKELQSELSPELEQLNTKLDNIENKIDLLINMVENDVIEKDKPINEQTVENLRKGL